VAATDAEPPTRTRDRCPNVQIGPRKIADLVDSTTMVANQDRGYPGAHSMTIALAAEPKSLSMATETL